MPTQPSERLTIDCWTLIPEILKRVVGRQASGQFVVRDGTIALPRRKLTSAGTYYAVFYLPSNERDLATGFFGLCCGEWELPKLILLVGHPSGFGEYQWRGVCPAILKPVQMLYFDPGTQLFVSREAVGKPPPISVQRVNDLRVVFGKLIEKYGSNGRSHPDLADHPVLAAFYRVVDSLKETDLAGDPDFAPFHSVMDIHADVLCALNGLPSPVLEESGAINVLATIHNPKERQRLPKRLLKKNMAPRLTPPIRTIEEARAELQRQGLPVDRILNALKSSRRS